MTDDFFKEVKTLTVSQIYKYMTDKVVPESVIPQNIHLCLMGEEDAPPPELDAFTFLNRLRALGIGSADFIYLLKGCNAPKEAIDKIEANPAMNLQMLIVTLESAGLKPQDYTRMLYTARQLWERTMTLHLDAAAQPAKAADLDEVSDAPDEVSDTPDEVSDTPDVDDTDEDIDIPDDVSDAPDEDDAPDDSDADDSEELPRKPLDEDAVRVDTGTSVMTQIDPSKYIIIPDDDDEAEESLPAAPDEPKKPVYAKGGIIAAACGAAVLFALAFTADYLGFEQVVEPIYTQHYAADNSEIFVEIYNAYHGGDYTADAVRYSDIGAVVFGDMLISLPDELGVIPSGEYVLSAERERITIYRKTEDSLAECGEILPPEGTEFFDILPRDNGITCLFAGSNSCGVSAYSADGKELFTTEQVGIPTDISINEDTVALATVYTPPFSESFTVEQTEHYLPYVKFNGTAELIPHERISLSGRANGCSYAVRSCVKLSDGTLGSANTAALGKVLHSAAPEFGAVIDSGEGIVILGDYSNSDGSFTETEISALIACDMGETTLESIVESDAENSAPSVIEKQPVFATAELTEDGTVVYLRGFDYQPVAAITNIRGEITDICIKDDILYICGAGKVLTAADISSPFDPKLLQLTPSEGVVKGDLALCSSLSETGLRLALYKLTSEGVTETASFSRNLTPYERESFVMAGGNTHAIFAEDRCGAAYGFFDGVSIVTEFALFGKAKQQTTMFDEKSGFTAAHLTEEDIYLIYGDEILKK